MHDEGIWKAATWIAFTSERVADFLQGYLTCDTQALTPMAPHPAALCNVKGRVVASGWAVLVDEQTIRFLVHESIGDSVVRLMTPYARFARCNVANIGAPYLRRQAAGEQTPIIGDWCLGEPGVSEVDVSSELAHALIDARFAFVSAAVSERFLPQMLGLDTHDAISFDKGCYLGQEIVARANFRGKVKRALVHLTWDGEPPVPGEPYADQGTVVECASDPKNELAGVALAVS